MLFEHGHALSKGSVLALCFHILLSNDLHAKNMLVLRLHFSQEIHLVAHFALIRSNFLAFDSDI